MSKTGKTDEKGVRLKFLLKIKFGLGRFDSNPIRPDFRMFLSDLILNVLSTIFQL